MLLKLDKDTQDIALSLRAFFGSEDLVVVVRRAVALAAAVRPLAQSSVVDPAALNDNGKDWSLAGTGAMIER